MANATTRHADTQAHVPYNCLSAPQVGGIYGCVVAHTSLAHQAPVGQLCAEPNTDRRLFHQYHLPAHCRLAHPQPPRQHTHAWDTNWPKVMASASCATALKSACLALSYLTSTSSTTKDRVAFGGMVGLAPVDPYACRSHRNSLHASCTSRRRDAEQCHQGAEGAQMPHSLFSQFQASRQIISS
jgi:hypothetical protein